MREASLDDITKFMECKRVAIVGVSRDSKHFSRLVFNEFVAKGYDAVPVNPHATEIGGRKCFACLADITPPVEAALLMTASPDATDQAVRECNDLNIRNLWIYKSADDGAHTDRVEEFCLRQNSALIAGYCPMMFLPEAGWFHRAHRLFMKVAGSHPH